MASFAWTRPPSDHEERPEDSAPPRVQWKGKGKAKPANLPSKQDFLHSLEPDDCPVCYREITKPVRIVCGHNFCAPCARKWFGEKNTCPTCRRELYQKARTHGLGEREQPEGADVVNQDASLSLSVLSVIDSMGIAIRGVSTVRDREGRHHLDRAGSGPDPDAASTLGMNHRLGAWSSSTAHSQDASATPTRRSGPSFIPLHFNTPGRWHPITAEFPGYNWAGDYAPPGPPPSPYSGRRSPPPFIPPQLRPDGRPRRQNRISPWQSPPTTFAEIEAAREPWRRSETLASNVDPDEYNSIDTGTQTEDVQQHSLSSAGADETLKMRPESSRRSSPRGGARAAGSAQPLQRPMVVSAASGDDCDDLTIPGTETSRKRSRML